MKKFGSLALAALLVTALSVSASAATYEAASGSPVVDGKKDNAYACAGIDVNLLEGDGSVATAGATGVAYYAWDNDYFYVFVDVTDPAVTDPSKVTSIWANDSIELYINLEGKDGAIADINAAQYTFGPSYTEFAGGGKHRTDNVDKAKSAYTYTDNGWTVELAIPWGSAYTPKVGATITGDVGINDDSDADPSSREQHVFSAAGLGSAWQTADSNWSTIKLTDTVYVEPVAEPDASATTADMGIVAALASLAASGAAVLSLKKRK